MLKQIFHQQHHQPNTQQDTKTPESRAPKQTTAAMYGSFGSYSSMSPVSITGAIDITPKNAYAHDRSCAFPSWPRRDSLSPSESDRPTSYLSDDDLFTEDPFEDDNQSISSSSSMHSPREEAIDLQNLEQERQAALQREAAMRYLANEKERRRQQAARRARAMRGPTSAGPTSSKKSPSKSKLASMTPINE